MDKRTSQRHTIRQQRRHLSVASQQTAAQQVCHLIMHSPLLTDNHHFAFYFANDGELDPAILLEHCAAQGKQCYLPCIDDDDDHQMAFFAYQPGDPLIANRFGIMQPVMEGADPFAAEKLDVVFTPLVQFDLQGNRLGMGAGYYDRHFAFLKKQHQPLLVGLAYDFQQTTAIAPEPWDIPLHYVVTDTQIYEVTP